MRTFRKRAERMNRTARRRFALLMLAPALLLCAWFMADAAQAAATENTYLLEVSTGARTSTGDEDKIDFFIITYAPRKGAGNQAQGAEKTVSKFLFPSRDGWKDTYALAKAAGGGQDEIDRAILDTYGYAGVDITAAKPLFQSYSTDQYLFTTPEPIGEIRRVQVFASDSGSWACRGMRVFRVDELGGLYRWNTASNDCYIDFEGDLIAEGTAGEASVGWQNDKLISSDIALDFKTSGFDPAYAHHALRANNTDKTVALRFDFADAYGAGLEALGAMSSKNNTLTHMGLAETMAVTLYYTDVYGMKRAANIPAVLNAATYTAELLGNGLNRPVGGFAQQGEGMALGVYLPDFARLDRTEPIVVTLGAAKAQSALGLTAAPGKPDSDTAELRRRRIALSESDTASFVTMAVYDLTANNVSISASVNESSGAIRYTYSGDPLYYQPVSAPGGAPLYTASPNRLGLTAYEHGKLLAPRDTMNTDRYLFELTTDEADGAGTKDDVLMRISYTDLNGAAKMTEALNVRELSRDFNGWWYGSAEQDIGYFKGVAAGQSLRFFVPMAQVKSIENVEVWMSETGSHDDWQMADLTISTVDFCDKRAVVWEAFSVDGVSAELSFQRDVTFTEIYRYTDTTENPVLLQQSADKSTDVGPNRRGAGGGSGGSGGGSGGGVEVAKAKDVDWSKIRYSMTFREASQELGFARERYVYAVTVKVGGAADASAEDGDCGSKNLFYFRLVFKNGSSGFVLANQQLSSDGFIAGASQTLYISTNQDYGDVTAVQIIPEDSSEDADVFDKLMIKSIQIKRQSNAALVPVWTVSKVGWISIDYRDQGQLTSVTGMAGRTATDLTRSYAVDGSTFDVNFMLAIQTEGYPEGAPQFEGSLSAIVYYDSYSPSKGYEEISDVTKNMYSYMNRTSRMADSVGGKTISDPSLMFRAGHTDRFYFSLSDVRCIRRIELQATSAVNTTWKIANVSLFMVNGEGSLVLNKSGEYQRVYDEDKQLLELAHSTSENIPAYQQILQAYDRTLNSMPATINISMTEREIPMNPEAKQWESIVAREPASENDTLNVFLYPDSDARADAVYSPVAVLQYTDASDKAIQVSSGDMNRATYNGREVFYVTGLNASRFGVLNSVNLRSGQGGGVRGRVRAIVQQVRSGVVIKTWDLEGSGSTGVGGMILGARSATSVPRQRVDFQLGTDTRAMALTPVGDDYTSSADNLAVALYYRADDPSGMELRTPYVYLTDLRNQDGGMTYAQIRPGQVISLSFDQKNVAEITGISVISTGGVSGTIESARVIDEEVEAGTGKLVATRGRYAFTEPLTVANVPYRMLPSEDGSVKRMTVTFATASAAGNVSTGTGGPVRMTLGYLDRYGDLIETVYDDIRPYITGGETGFAAGSTVSIELQLRNADNLRWVELEPYGGGADTAAETGPASETDPAGETGETTETGQASVIGQETDKTAQKAMWTLKELTVSIDGGQEINREWNTRLIEGEPQKIFLAEILLRGTAYVPSADAEKSGNAEDAEAGEAGGNAGNAEAAEAAGKAEGETEFTVEGGQTLELTRPSGQGFRLIPRISGSAEGMDIALYGYDPETRLTMNANLDATHGYEDAYLGQIETVAQESLSASVSDEKERAAAQKVLDAVKALRASAGKFEAGSTETRFTAPANYTGTDLRYRLIVSAKEAPEIQYALDITVKAEANPLAAALDEWEALRTVGEIVEADRDAAGTTRVKLGETAKIFLHSGGSVTVTPHLSSSESYTHELQKLDPGTGATGQADLTPSYGYTAAELGQLSASVTAASGGEDITEAERSAAAMVFQAIEEVQSGGGEYAADGDAIRFTAPRNFSGGNLSYRLSVYGPGADEILFIADITVAPESNPLTNALSRWDTAHTAGAMERQAKAAAEAAEAAAAAAASQAVNW